MLKVYFVLPLALLCACAAPQAQVAIYQATPQGAGKLLGQIKATDTKAGLRLDINLKDIPEGPHGFHIHENPNCSNTAPDGKTAPAAGAGGHYDPDKTAAHKGPAQTGHKGDLPFLNAAQDGTVKQTVIAPRLKLKDISNRAFVIHAGGDNYSDAPLALGGGGARIACGTYPAKL